MTFHPQAMACAVDEEFPIACLFDHLARGAVNIFGCHTWSSYLSSCFIGLQDDLSVALQFVIRFTDREAARQV
jgi:hypothetical protein